ncbi:hypothetical protein MCAP1_000349, partial [Malassezia caprae]
MHSPLATYDGSTGAYIAEDGTIVHVSWSETPIVCTELGPLPPSVYARTSDHLPTLVAVNASTWLASGDTNTL